MMPGVPGAAQTMCECCARPAAVTPRGRTEFRCGCMSEVLCRACNHCLKHCKCEGVAEIDLPYPAQLVIARAELAALGVKA